MAFRRIHTLLLLAVMASCQTVKPSGDGTGGSASNGGLVASLGGGSGGKGLGGGAPVGGGPGGSSVGGSDDASTGGADSSGGKSEMGGGKGDGGNGTGGADTRPTFVFVGSGDWNSEPGKISVYSLDRSAPKLDFIADYPSGGLATFMAFDVAKRRVFVADEKNGGVISFSVDPASGALTNLGATQSPNHPVYLRISPDGKYLLGANYNEGSVDVYPIGDDGKAQASLGSVATGSHAHSVHFDLSGRVLVMNEGANTISNLVFAAGELSAGTPASSESFSPRHATFDANGRVYVVSEKGDHVTAYSAEASGALTQLWQEKRLDQGSPTGNTGADIHLTPDDRFLYATNRGSSNSVVQWDISGKEPKLLGHISSEGTTPRNFSMDPLGQLILVGNHGTTKSLALFRIGADGKLSRAAVLNTAFSPYFVHLVQF